MPKLQHIDHVQIGGQNVDKLRILSDKYKRSLNCITISIQGMKVELFRNVTSYISRLELLESLNLEILACKSSEPIDECLIQMHSKLTKLKKYTLNVNTNIPISDRFFSSFSVLNSIEELNLSLDIRETINGNIKDFKGCSKLKTLSIGYRKLKEDFFADVESIENVLPNIESLDIQTNDAIPNALKKFPKLKVEEYESDDSYSNYEDNYNYFDDNYY